MTLAYNLWTGGPMETEPQEQHLVVRDGVLVFVGELDGDPNEVLNRDREDRAQDLLETAES